MALIELKLPSGIYSNGTEFESSGRWKSGNLIRWQNDSIRPVGGWNTRIANVVDEPPRAAHGWLDNSHDPHIAIGTYNQLYVITASGSATDITPAGFVVGNNDATENTGYGGKSYGTYVFGIDRQTDGVVLEATTWQLDNWGEYLIACSMDDGKLYEWDLAATTAYQIPNSPENCVGLIATAERFVFALGANGNPRQIAWCDREDNTTWTPEATNEAGDFELQTDGEIMCAAKVRGRTLIVTTRDAHIATYSGPPTVYGFERVGASCGAATRKGLVAVGEGAFWMGTANFFAFNGSSVSVLKCDVMDHVFSNINRDQISKAFGVHNGHFGEIWWFYPAGDSLENDSYVVYDYQEGIWTVGKLNRTAGFDAGVFTTPIWFDELGTAYNHETGYSFGGSLPYIESGPISIGVGDNVMHLTQVIPDELNQGDVTAIIKTRFHPNDTEREYGPYSMTAPTSIRATGRQVSVRFTGKEYADWRVGKMRINVEQGGKR